MRSFVFACVALGLVLPAVGHSDADQLKLVALHLQDTTTGLPAENQTVLIKGKPDRAWYSPRVFFHGVFSTQPDNDISVVAVTDKAGFVQIVDLPAGSYQVKAIVPRGEPVPVLLKAADTSDGGFVVGESYVGGQPGTTFTLKPGYKYTKFTGRMTVPEDLKIEESLWPVIKRKPVAPDLNK